MKDWTAAIEDTIRRVREARGKLRGKAIKCPICGGWLQVSFSAQDRAAVICPPKAEGKPYCINWIE